MQTRRAFIQTGLATAGTLALGSGFWREALAAPARPGPGPYGPPVGAPNALGLTLPEGFSSRLIARGGQPVLGTAYDWHIFSDGAATFPLEDGGWILVSNSETPIPAGDLPVPSIGGGPQNGGGASSIRFNADGSIADAYRILSNTNTNCAGGKTPWGTWMSCEEIAFGAVWECDPTGAKPAVRHPAMGLFEHEALAVDPVGKRLYLTEDAGDSGFYRFTPDDYPDCSAGLLEIARVDGAGVVRWNRVPDPSGASDETRKQVPRTEFKRGEGAWYDSGIVYVATTSDNKIHAYDPLTETIEVVYDQRVGDGPLNGVDNVTAAPSGDIYVCEDNGTNQIDMGIVTPEGEVARFLTASGSQHEMSELAGVCFDPSGKRMYFASQRSFGGPGALFEVTGPFREAAQNPVPVGGGLRLAAYAARTVAIPAFMGRGMAVELRVNQAATGVVAIRTKVDGRTVTLGRTTATLEAGKPLRVRLRPSRGARAALRGRSSVDAYIRSTIRAGAVKKAFTRDVRFVKVKRPR